MGKSSETYYAVKVGHQPGVYRTWPDAEKQVKGFQGAQHKKFKTIQQARAFIGFDVQSPGNTPTRSPHETFKGEDATIAGQKRPAPPSSSDERQAKRSRPSMISYNSDPAMDSGRAGNLCVYADGSCIGNGKRKARAGIGLFWVGCAHLGSVAERLPGRVQTNNRAELYAFIRAFELDPDPQRHLDIYTDSQYAIQCVTVWASAWSRKNWKTSKGEPVENQDLIRLALQIMNDRPGSVKYTYVKAHCGIEGNERADRAAKEGAMMPELPDRDLAAELASLNESNKSSLRATSEIDTSTSSSTSGASVTSPVKMMAGGSQALPAPDISEDWLLSAEDEATLFEDI